MLLALLHMVCVLFCSGVKGREGEGRGEGGEGRGEEGRGE